MGDARHIADLVPLYLVFDGSAAMSGEPMTVTNRFIGEILDAITSSPELSLSVRLCLASISDIATVLLPLADVDATITVPQASAGTTSHLTAAGLLALRGIIDQDWAQLEADALPTQPPLAVLITAGGPLAALPEWEQALRAPEHGLATADGTTIWPPQLVVVAAGRAQLTELGRLASADRDVVEIAAPNDVQASTGVVVSVLGDRVALGDDHLLRRWVVPLHKLGGLVPVGFLGDREVLTLAEPLPELDGSIRFLRYGSPRVLGDSLGGLLRVLALQESDLAASLSASSMHVDWPARLVVADHDVTTVVGVLIPDPVQADAPPSTGMTMRLPDLARASHSRLVDSILYSAIFSPEENAALIALRACRRMALCLDMLDLRQVVLGQECPDAVRVDLSGKPSILLDRIDLALVVSPADDDHDRLVGEDLRWLARTIADVLGSKDGSAVPALDPKGHSMLARSLSDPHGTPTSAFEWCTYLGDRIAAVQGPPRIAECEVTPLVAPSGARVVLTWRTHLADTLQVSTPDGRTLTVRVEHVRAGSMSITVTAPGSIRIEARNSLTTSAADSPWVHVFDPADLLGLATTAPNPFEVVSLPDVPTPPQLTAPADALPYPGVLAYSDVIAEISPSLEGPPLVDGLSLIAPPDASAPGPDGLDSLDAARWFSAPPALRPGRARRRKRGDTR